MPSGYVDPNGDGSTLQWTPTPTGTHYTTVDDAVRQPTAGGTTDYVTMGGSATGNDEFLMSSIAGIASFSQIVVWAYGLMSGFNPGCKVQVYTGAAWQTGVSLAFTASASWKSATFSGTWTQTDLDALQVRLAKTGLGGVTVYEVYGDVTYTPTTTYEHIPKGRGWGPGGKGKGAAGTNTGKWVTGDWNSPWNG